ncbi:MAG: threonine--tRNA ligase [Candidatus Nanopelagicales bacterium]|nr:threonine--tRNA ligase [Candidatus Nanopelagicales bacterium]MDZ4250707.1 threonine--tRNA ligase [Candidatus Nanopelagicales bacterium]
MRPEAELSQMQVQCDGQDVALPEDGRAADLAGNDRAVVVARVNGELVDLDHVLAPGDTVEMVRVDSPDGLHVLRHSVAHVLAQAVQELHPEAKLGFGPPIRDGFYYDFRVSQPFTAEDLAKIQARTVQILKSGQKFGRRVLTEDEARNEFADEPFKLWLIGREGGAEEAADLGAETGGKDLTVYDSIDPRTGERTWGDMCRGPHVPTTRHIPSNAVKLMRSSAAYWLGDDSNEQLQRIYGTAWPDKAQLRAYETFLEEAARRDHRRLGAELDLFSFPEEVGSGLPVFHPKGGVVRRVMEDYSRKRHQEGGYEFVTTPHLSKAELFNLSGHLQWYRESMYPPMELDAEYAADGHVKRAPQQYYLKPMNCPMHNLIYRSRGRSYRELPLRLFEFGTVYRYEKSGVVQGLTRARGFTQDDAHIYCTKEQMHAELDSLLEFVLDLLRDFGLADFYLELSTRDPDKSVGSEADWAEATQYLREAGERQGLELVMDEGGAAFYGPKISVQTKDAIGRTWQMSTIQVDFQLPLRFDLEYTAADGSRQQPVMIHRALFGSMERFFAVLLEHYAGAFPAWLAPVQVVCIPIADQHVRHLEEVASRLRGLGVRVEVDDGSDRMQKKIRNAQRQKVPYMLLAGDDDVAAVAVSFRYRSGDQKNGVPIPEAVAEIADAVSEHRRAV